MKGWCSSFELCSKNLWYHLIQLVAWYGGYYLIVSFASPNLYFKQLISYQYVYIDHRDNMAFDHCSFLFTFLSFTSEQNGPSSILPTHVGIFSTANGFLITSKNDSQFLVPPQVMPSAAECWAHMDIQNYGPWKRWLLFKIWPLFGIYVKFLGCKRKSLRNLTSACGILLEVSSAISYNTIPGSCGQHKNFLNSSLGEWYLDVPGS